MLAIRLPETIEERLNTLASETGRTKTALAREAIVEYIDDLEDYYLAEARARRNRKTIPLAWISIPEFSLTRAWRGASILRS